MQEIKKNISLENVAAAAIFVFIAECTFGSSGRWLSIGPLSIRMILFAVTFLLTLPIVLKNFKTLVKKPQVVLLFVFGAFVLLSIFVGFKNHNRTAFIRNDVSSILTFALFPGFIIIAQKKRMASKIVNIIFWSTVFVALVATAIHFAIPFLTGDQINWVNDWINDRSLGGLALLNSGSYRIYFRAEIFLQVSILLGVWKIREADQTKKVILYISEAFLAFALLISYTRGFWLGFAVMAVFFLACEPRQWKQCFISAGIVLVLVAGILGISWLCYCQPAGMTEAINRVNMTQTLDDDDDDAETDVDVANKNAAKLRSESLALLQQRISNHVLIGNGWGTNLDEIRDDGKTEYMYLDILMKMGLFGFISYLLVSFGFLPRYFKELKQKKNLETDNPMDSDRIRCSMLVAGYIGVAVTSFFNPFLTTPMGIMLLMSVYASVYSE
jgi:hypothetical protein